MAEGVVRCPRRHCGPPSPGEAASRPFRVHAVCFLNVYYLECGHLGAKQRKTQTLKPNRGPSALPALAWRLALAAEGRLRPELRAPDAPLAFTPCSFTAPHPPLAYLGRVAAGTHPLPRVGDPVAAQATTAGDRVRTTRWLGPVAESPTSLGPYPSLAKTVFVCLFFNKIFYDTAGFNEGFLNPRGGAAR